MHPRGAMTRHRHRRPRRRNLEPQSPCVNREPGPVLPGPRSSGGIRRKAGDVANRSEKPADFEESIKFLAMLTETNDIDHIGMIDRAQVTSFNAVGSRPARHACSSD